MQTVGVDHALYIGSERRPLNYIFKLNFGLLVHGEKFISKLYDFNKKIHYFFSDAGTHSKSRIFTILNSTF